MERFVAGFRRFRQGYYRTYEPLFATLASQGQAPRAMVISCSDARVDPGILFQAEPGDLFVARNVANLVPPYAPDADYHGTSAALEFAVTVLQIENVLVLGHAHCGGIRTLLEDGPPRGEFIGPWMAIAEPARQRALLAHRHGHDSLHRLCEHESIRQSLANLATYPWIRERVAAGHLALHGWYYDLVDGRLWRLAGSGRFEAV